MFALKRSGLTPKITQRKPRWGVYVTVSGFPLLNGPQILYHEAVVWKHMRHPNIVPFHGTTLNPPQLVSDWMEYGNLTEFLRERTSANRLGLVRVPPTLRVGFWSSHPFISYTMSLRA